MPSQLRFTPSCAAGASAVILACALTVPGEARRAAPVRSPTSNGIHSVSVVTQIVLTDAKRNRKLPLKVYVPQTRGKYPVILFSHGAGGSRDSFGPLARFWASHGFVTIHPAHADPRTAGAAARSNPDRVLSAPAVWQNRARDLSFILDSLREIEQQAPALRGKMDSSHIGVSGHSFGAFTAMLLGGATVDLPGGVKGQGLADPRVTSVLAFSPSGTGQLGLTVRSWLKMTLPLMTLAGSRDFGPARQGPEWRKQPFRFSPTGDKFHVLIRDANHLSYGGELAGGGLTSSTLGPRTSAELRAGRRFAVGTGGGAYQESFRAVKASTLAFWSAFLKLDAGAKSYLTSHRLNVETAGKAIVESK